MMTENDGKNAAQLKEYARLPEFVDRLVRTRLPESRGVGNWPEESDTVNLGMWLMWMCTDTVTLQAETPESREQLISLLLPYVICAFHYAPFHAADLHYILPLVRDENPDYLVSSISVHGDYPQYIRASKVLRLYNQHITLARPPAVQAAQLLYFSRREQRGLPIPHGIPANRTVALTQGLETGPTVADYEEFNAHPCARVLASGTWDAAAALTPGERRQEESPGWIPGEPPTAVLSGRFDADWNRLVSCVDPWGNPEIAGPFACYARGALVGRWVGRMLLPVENQYMQMIGQPNLSPYFSEMNPFTTVRPLMMTLKEHHCISPEEPIETVTREPGQIDDGLRNAYMPPLQMLAERSGVTFAEPNNLAKIYRYESIKRGRPSSHSSETCDYCHLFHYQDEQNRAAARARREEIEAAFEEGGLGQSADVDMEEDDDDDDMTTDDENEGAYDDEEEDGEGDANDEWEMTVERGDCHGVIDVVFTGLTEKRHGDAWCHYMYYGRLRIWDGLIVLVGVPNDLNARLWGRWIFRGYLHAGQNFTGRWRHYAYDTGHPPYEGAFSLSKRDEEDQDE